MPKDTLTVIDNRTGKSYEIPIQYGTYPGYGAAIRTADLRQIKATEDDFGLMGYDPAFGATWQGNLALQVRPVRAWLASGRDLFAGVETSYRTSADGTRQRLVVGPSIAVVPLRPLWLQAFYGRPIYEKADPAGSGGGSSIWLRAYVVR